MHLQALVCGVSPPRRDIHKHERQPPYKMSPLPRPTLDQYFMEIAAVVAKRSTCLRNQVGAVLVRDKRILSTGYNGAPAGLEHCDSVGCAREGVESGTRHELCRAVHAEQNAIIQAALHGIGIEGATLVLFDGITNKTGENDIIIC